MYRIAKPVNKSKSEKYCGVGIISQQGGYPTHSGVELTSALQAVLPESSVSSCRVTSGGPRRCFILFPIRLHSLYYL